MTQEPDASHPLDPESDDGLTATQDHAPRRAPLRRNVAQMLTSQLLTWSLALVNAVVVPRALGPNAQGELALAIAFWGIASVLIGLGTSMYIQLEVARDPAKRWTVAGPVLAIRTLVWTISSVVLAVYVAAVAEGWTFVWLMLAIGVSTIIGSWSEVIAMVFIGLERMSVPAVVSVAAKVVNVVVVLGLLAAGVGALGVALASIVAGVGTLLLYGWRFRTIGSLRTTGWTRQWREVVRASAPFLGVTLAVVLYLQIDVITISWVAGSREVGWYATADTLVGSLLFPATIVVGAMFPTLGRLYVTDKAAMEDLVRRTFLILMVAAVPIGMGVMVVGPAFSEVVYGAEYSGTGEALVAFGPRIMLMFGTILFGNVALTTERGKFWVVVILTAAIATVPLDLMLVPWAQERYDNGAIGGAISYVVTETAQFIIGVIYIAPFVLQRSTMWRAGRALAAGGLMVACTWPLRHNFFPITVLVGAFVYIGAVLLLRVLPESEILLARRLISRTRQDAGTPEDAKNGV